MSSFPNFPSGAIYDPALRIPVVIQGQTFNVWDEGRTETFAHAMSPQKATWMCQCLWEDRLGLKNALLGGSVNVTSVTTYSNGWQYPDNPIWRALTVQTEGQGVYAQGITAQQRTGNADTIGVYPRAKLTVGFGVPEYNLPTYSNNIGEDELDFGVKTFPLPDKNFVLQYNDGTPCPPGQCRSVQVGVVNFSRNLYNVAVLPETTIQNLINCTNSSPIFGAGAGQIIFKGGRSKHKITPQGNINWDVTFNFCYITPPAGWNSLPQAGKTPVWQAVAFTDGSLQFPLKDLNALFL